MPAGRINETLSPRTVQRTRSLEEAIAEITGNVQPVSGAPKRKRSLEEAVAEITGDVREGDLPKRERSLEEAAFEIAGPPPKYGPDRPPTVRKNIFFDQPTEPIGPKSPEQLSRARRLEQRRRVEEFTEGMPPESASTFGRGVARGFYQIGEGLSRFSEMYLDKKQQDFERLGLPTEPVKALKDKARSIGDSLKAQSQTIPFEVESLADVENSKDVLSLATKAIGEFSPQIALGVVGGAAGQVGGKLGTALGAGAVAYPLETGHIFEEIRERTGEERPGIAAGTGLFAAALEAYTPFKVVEGLLDATKGPAKKKLWRKVVKDVALKTALRSGQEGATEAGQEAIAIAAQRFADNTYQIVNSENAWRLLDAGFAGMAGGAAIGGITTAGEETVRQLRGTEQRKDGQQQYGVEKGDIPFAPLGEKTPEQEQREQEFVDELASLVEHGREEDQTEQQLRSAIRRFNEDVMAGNLGQEFAGQIVQQLKDQFPQHAELINEEVQNALKKRQEQQGSLGERFRDDEPVQEERQDREYQAEEQAPRDEDRERGSVLDEAKRQEVDQAGEQTDTSPSAAQIESGRYKKGKVKIDGLSIRIENPKGSVRTSKPGSKEKWSVTMPADYGYIEGTKGKDKDQIDVYIGPNPDSGNVYVVDQYDADTGKFDEHKVMYGFNSLREAVTTYEKAFSDRRGSDRARNIESLGKSEFKAWLKKANKQKPSGQTAGQFRTAEAGRVKLKSKQEIWDRIWEKWAPLFAKLNVRVVTDNQVGSLSARMSLPEDFQLRINPSALSEQAQQHSPEMFAEWTERGFEEELLHFAFAEYIRRRWDGTGNWQAFLRNEADKIYQAMTPDQRQQALKAYTSGEQKDLPGWYIAFEYVRQLGQFRRFGHLTEQLNNATESFRLFLRDFVDFIRRLFGAGEPNPIVDTVNEIDRILDEVEASPRARAPPVTPAPDIPVTGEEISPGMVAPTPEAASQILATAKPRGEQAVASEAQMIAGQVEFIRKKMQQFIPKVRQGLEGALDAALKKIGYDNLNATGEVIDKVVQPEDFYQGLESLGDNPLRESFAKEAAMRLRLAEHEWNKVLMERDKLRKRIESEAFQKRLARMDARAAEQALIELAESYFQTNVEEALRAFAKMVPEQARIQGRAEGLNKAMALEHKQQFGAAVKSAIRDLVETFGKNAETVNPLQELLARSAPDMAELIAEYKRRKTESRHDDMVVRWAGQILKEHSDMAEKLFALEAVQKQQEVADAYNEYVEEFSKQLKSQPAKTARRLVRRLAKGAVKKERARVAFNAMHKELELMATDLETLELAGEMIEKIQADPVMQQYRKDVYREGKVQDRPEEFIRDHPDMPKLQNGIPMPNGERTKPIVLHGDSKKFEESFNELNRAANAIAEWLGENPDHTQSWYWNQWAEYLHNVLATQRTLSPPKLRAMLKHWGPWGMTKFFVDDLGTRAGALLRVSLDNHSRSDELAKNLLHENFDRLMNTVLRAARSHNFHTLRQTNSEASVMWHSEIGNALMSSWQNPEGGLGLGDKVNGHEITQADMAALKTISDLSRRGFEIVQKDIRASRGPTAQPTIFLTDIANTGVRIALQSTRVGPNTVTRKFDEFARQIVQDYSRATTPAEKIRVLNANFWNVVTRHIADRSNVFFDGESTWEQTYQTISREIQTNGLAYENRNMRWFVDRIVSLNPDHPLFVRQDGTPMDYNEKRRFVISDLVTEFDTMMGRLNREMTRDLDEQRTTVETLETKGSFTESRKVKLAGDWLYIHGFRDGRDFTNFSFAITSYYYTRAANDFLLVRDDLQRQKTERERKMSELSAKLGIVSREQLKRRVETEQSRLVQMGETYDDYVGLDQKLAMANKYIDKFKGVYDPKNRNIDYDTAPIRQIMGTVVGSVLISELTALRNFAFAWYYIGNFQNSVMGQTVGNYSKAFYELYVVQLPKYFAAGLYGLARFPTVGAARGIKDGILSPLSEGQKMSFTKFVRPMLEEMSQYWLERVTLQKELFDAGFARRHYTGEAFEAKTSFASEGGMVRTEPAYQNIIARMGFSGLMLFDAALLTTVGRPLFPRMADLAVNTATVKTVYDMTQRLEDHVKARWKLSKDTGTPRFDVENPLDPKNRLAPHEALGRGFIGKPNETHMTQLRLFFEHGAIGYDQAVMRLVAQLESGNLNATLLTDAERMALADIAAEEVNKASATNRPLHFKEPGWVQFVAPLMGWNTHAFRAFIKNFSRGAVDPKSTPMHMWATTLMLVMLPAIAAAPAASYYVEWWARVLYRFIRGEERPTRLPHEREGARSKAIGWAISVGDPIPFMQTVANSALNDMPNRASGNPILFIQNKLMDVFGYVGNVVQTGRITYGLDWLLKGTVPAGSAVINRLPGVAGNMHALNARRLMTRYGDFELLQQKGSYGRGASRKLTELSPYPNMMLNAAMLGDTDKFMEIYERAVELATEMEKPEPEKYVAGLFSARNPYDRAFKRKLTAEERRRFLDRLDPREAALIEDVEDKFRTHAELIGAAANFSTEDREESEETDRTSPFINRNRDLMPEFRTGGRSRGGAAGMLRRGR